MKNVCSATAPGRLDVMGGIADYSGSLVLQMPIRQETHVEIESRSDNLCVVHSSTGNEELSVKIDYASLLQNGEVDYGFACDKFRQDPNTSWIAYILGCVLVLQKEKGLVFKGAVFKINTTVPLGKGVSSSASLEVATMKALRQLYDVQFSGTELPVLAQKVENLVVGAPCGLMDQLASYFGESGKLLPILCQPDQIQDLVVVPDMISFMGIDSGERHSVQGASYGDVRCAAFMGYTMIASAYGADRRIIQEYRAGGNRNLLPYHGYLCNISVKEFEDNYKRILPEKISGKEFIELYGSTIDGVTKVNADVNYSVLNCTKHPVYENERVLEFKNLLRDVTHQQPDPQEIIYSLGNLMYQSHESYSLCGLGSEKTDELVRIAKSLASKGIAGAKITGGGSGGTVCFLAHGDIGKQTVRELHKEFGNRYQMELALF